MAIKMAGPGHPDKATCYGNTTCVMRLMSLVAGPSQAMGCMLVAI